MKKRERTELELAIMWRKRKKKLKHDKLCAKLGIETPEQAKERYEEDMDFFYNAVPLERKQFFLDLFNKGIPLGKAAEETGIDMEIATQVIIRNAVGLIPVKAIK